MWFNCGFSMLLGWSVDTLRALEHIPSCSRDGGWRISSGGLQNFKHFEKKIRYLHVGVFLWAVGGGARQSNTKLDVQFRPPRRKCGEASKVRQVKGSAPTVAVASVERWKVMAAHSDFEAGPFVCCPLVLKCDVWLVWQACVPKTIYNTQEKAISSVRAQHYFW